jgi:predicted transcriptional regulator
MPVFGAPNAALGGREVKITISLSDMDKKVLAEIKQHELGIDCFELCCKLNSDVGTIKPILVQLCDAGFLVSGLHREGSTFNRKYIYIKGLVDDTEVVK